MGHLLAQVRLRRETNLAEDDIINTWHFGTPLAAPTASDITSVRDRLRTFYGATPGIRDYWSPVLLDGTDVHRIRFYNMALPKPRPPLADEGMTVTQRAVSPMPSEVAVVLSFSSGAPTNVPPARRRGRIYLGPLNVDINEAYFGDARPDPIFVNHALTQASALIGGTPTTTPIWSVYSPTNDALYPVDRVCVDNSFDTQRRRGSAPNVRTCQPPLPT